MNFVELFFTPRGRVPRSTFWMVFLIWIMIDIVLRGAMSLVSLWSGNEVVVAIFFWAWLIYSISSYFPMIALAIKRLHDTGRSGYWMLVPIGCQIAVLMMVLSFFRSAAGTGLMFALLALALLLASLIVFVFFVLAGDEHSNEYGLPH